MGTLFGTDAMIAERTVRRATAVGGTRVALLRLLHGVVGIQVLQRAVARGDLAARPQCLHVLNWACSGIAMTWLAVLVLAAMSRANQANQDGRASGAPMFSRGQAPSGESRGTLAALLGSWSTV